MAFDVAGGAARLAAAPLDTAAAQVFHAPWRFEPGVMLQRSSDSAVLMLLLGFAATSRARLQPAAARPRLEAGE